MRSKCLTVTVMLMWLACVTAAYAGDSIRLHVNGREIRTDVPPQLIDGRLMVPVRWVAEALGARVNWDGQKGLVTIDSREQDSLQHRLDLLERVVAPRTPKEVVETWAEGVKSRNGALQYAVLAPELKEDYRNEFESCGWVTGTSSPWVEHYTIINERQETGNWLFTVQFNMITSVGSAGFYTSEIMVKQQDEHWWVAGIDDGLDQRWKEAQLKKQLDDLLSARYQHYQILEEELSLQSITSSGSEVEAEYLTKVTTVINVATPAEWPSVKGMHKYLEENRDSLSPEALQTVEEYIAFWDKELRELYIGVPYDGYDYIKIRAEFDDQGTILEDNLRFYTQEPMDDYMPLEDLDPPYIQSEEDLIKQWYKTMEQLVESKFGVVK